MKTNISVTLYPAPGRVYHSAAEVETDFYLGRDFRHHGAPGLPPSFCSVRNFEAGTILEFEYGPGNRKKGSLVVKGGDSK